MKAAACTIEGHGPSRHIRPGSQLNAASFPFYSCGPFHTIGYNLSRVVKIKVSWSPSFDLDHLFEVGLMQNPVENERLLISCHVGLH